MLTQQADEEPVKVWFPYVVGMAAAAIFSTLGAELVKWGVDELRLKYGTPKEK